jgi:hypothetical protein
MSNSLPDPITIGDQRYHFVFSETSVGFFGWISFLLRILTIKKKIIVFLLVVFIEIMICFIFLFFNFFNQCLNSSFNLILNFFFYLVIFFYDMNFRFDGLNLFGGLTRLILVFFFNYFFSISSFNINLIEN